MASLTVSPPNLAASITASIEAKQQMLEPDRLQELEAIAAVWIQALRSGHTVFFFGNGGSSTDAQHIAGELLGRFRLERAALPASCLSDSTSAMTAIANDYGYEHVFARQLSGVGRQGDVAVGFSTSGNSENVRLALVVARERGLVGVAMTGRGGGKIADEADVTFHAPSTDTPRIQECHLLAGHALCEIVEARLQQPE